jgi:hypothetical protein
MSSLTPEEEAVERHKGNKAAAARFLGIAPTTLKGRLDAIKRPPRIEPPPPSFSPSKPVIRVKAVTQETALEGPIRKVVAIGDLHQKPGRSHERFTWIGRFVADEKPDNVISIGDFATLDSLSSHDKPGSRQYHERPHFAADMEDLAEALDTYHREIGIGQVAHDITYGNHEFRAWRAEDASPNLKDTLVLPIEQSFARHRWRTHGYGEWLFLEGVGCTHVPFNSLGRDFRGEHVENQLGPRAVFSIIFGHVHKESHKIFPKIGPQRRIEICNLGTAMPHGEVEHYAGLSMTGWSWGVKVLRLQAGHIVGHSFVSMLELEQRFGDHAGRAG